MTRCVSEKPAACFDAARCQKVSATVRWHNIVDTVRCPAGGNRLEFAYVCR